jgi:hypothetical protein
MPVADSGIKISFEYNNNNNNNNDNYVRICDVSGTGSIPFLQ